VTTELLSRSNALQRFLMMQRAPARGTLFNGYLWAGELRFSGPEEHRQRDWSIKRATAYELRSTPKGVATRSNALTTVLCSSGRTIVRSKGGIMIAIILAGLSIKAIRRAVFKRKWPETSKLLTELGLQ
jgi:hypothetical protein